MCEQFEFFPFWGCVEHCVYERECVGLCLDILAGKQFHDVPIGLLTLRFGAVLGGFMNDLEPVKVANNEKKLQRLPSDLGKLVD